MQFTRDKHSQPTIASTNASRTMQLHRPKLALELAIHHAEKYFNFFSPSLHEKIKTPDTQADTTKTVELNNNHALQTRWTRTPAGNMRLASCGVKCLNSSAVFQINFSAGLTVLCSEIPHERQAWER